MSGSGTEADPYNIETAEDLWALAGSVNGGSSYAASGTVYADYQKAEIISSRTMGGNEGIPTYSGARLDQSTGTMIGHIGNGYVEITPYEDTMPIEYTGQVGSFTAP